MKRIPLIFILFSMLFVMAACTSDETVNKEVVLPEDIPDFVQVSDFETIDWEKKSVEFGDRDIVGNENKSGVIGQDMKSAKVENNLLGFYDGLFFHLDLKKGTIALFESVSC